MKESYSNITNQPTQSPHLSTTSFTRISQVEPLSHPLITVGDQRRTTQTVPIYQSLLKSLKLANSTPRWPVYPASSISSPKTHNQDSHPCCPFTPPVPRMTLEFPCSPTRYGMPLPLQYCERQTIFSMATLS